MAWEREQIGGCTLYRGDCLEILPTLTRVDAVVTDPPYGVGLGSKKSLRKHGGYGSHLRQPPYRSYEDTYANFCAQIVPRLNLALDHSPVAAVFTGPHIHEQRKPTAMGGVYFPAAGGRTAWGSKTLLPVLFYGIPPRAGQHRRTVLHAGANDTHITVGVEHPCVKPVAWMAWLVQLASDPGGQICDPFAGTFTTAVACVQLGRRCVSIELEQAYFDEGCRRVEEVYAQGDFFRSVHVARQQTLFG